MIFEILNMVFEKQDIFSKQPNKPLTDIPWNELQKQKQKIQR